MILNFALEYNSHIYLFIYYHMWSETHMQINVHCIYVLRGGGLG